jgi:hypothetical protein
MVNQLIQDPNKLIRDTPSEKLLSQGFAKLGFTKGIKSYANIKSEYDSLQLILSNSNLDETIVNLVRIRDLSDKIYKHAITLLISLLDITQQLRLTDYELLSQETNELKEELKSCSPKLRGIINDRLEKNTNSLALVKSHKDRSDEILCQAGLCIDSIREIRLSLPRITSHLTEDEFEKVLLELRTRVDFAQRVHDEYARQGI